MKDLKDVRHKEDDMFPTLEKELDEVMKLVNDRDEIETKLSKIRDLLYFRYGYYVPTDFNKLDEFMDFADRIRTMTIPYNEQKPLELGITDYRIVSIGHNWVYQYYEYRTRTSYDGIGDVLDITTSREFSTRYLAKREFCLDILRGNETLLKLVNNQIVREGRPDERL